MKTAIFTRKIFQEFPFLITISILLLLVASLMDAASIFSLIIVVDLFINQNLSSSSLITRQIIDVFKFFGFPHTFNWLLGFFLIFNLLKVSFQIFAQKFILRTKYSLLREIMVGTFEDFFNARWYFFSSNKQGMLINVFIREMNVVGDAFSAMARYFSGILQIILYLLVPFYLSWQVSSVTIIAALLFALPFFMLGRVSYRLGKLNTSTANEIGSVIQENLSLSKIVLGFGKQRKSIEKLSGAFDSHRKATVKSQLFNFSMPLIYFPFGILVLIIGLFVAQRLTLPLSETAVLFYALARLIPAMSQLTQEKSILDNFFPSYELIMNLRHSAIELKQTSGSRKFQGFNSEIALEGLSFFYSGRVPVLRNINIRIPKGRMVAIVGMSGAGKSTLIDLLMGFYEPTEGRVIFDKTLLQEFDISTFRDRIGYVPQDSVLFNMSIRDNLTWAYESASLAEIQQACQLANVEEFIEKFPKGYDTLVGDRGVRLSGGQIQRIALARAILRKPELLVLDEATSALDTYSERLIQQAIEAIARETTVIVVAHRLSTIRNADYIYVLGDGNIIEEGRYSDLIQKNGHFSKMVELQSLAV